MNPFEKMNAVAEKYNPTIVKAITETLGYVLVDVSGLPFQFEGADSIAVNPITGKSVKLEKKVRQKDYTGKDVLFEDWSDYPNREGWALTSTADILAMLWVDTGRFLVLEWLKTKSWYITARRPPFNGDDATYYPLMQQTQTEQDNDTRFRCVPIRDLPPDCILYYSGDRNVTLKPLK
jgi:hypothetical protein